MLRFGILQNVLIIFKVATVVGSTVQLTVRCAVILFCSTQLLGVSNACLTCLSVLSYNRRKYFLAVKIAILLDSFLVAVQVHVFMHVDLI